MGRRHLESCSFILFGIKTYIGHGETQKVEKECRKKSGNLAERNGQFCVGLDSC